MTRTRSGPNARRRVLGTLATAAVVALVVVGAGACSSSGDSDSDDAGASFDEGQESGEAAPGDEAGGDGSGAGGGGEVDARADVDVVALVQQREVIRTGSMELTVDDAEEAATAVRQLVDDAGGFVADERAVTRDSEATVTVRVPSGAFEDLRADIAELGEVVEQTVEAEDVTAEVVDVQSRIDSLRGSVARLQEMLGGAGDVAQLATVEGELSRREVELEAMLGQQRLLEDQVALGTLAVHLSEDPPPPAPDDDAAGFTDGLRTGWAAFVDGGRAVLAAAGFLLPFAVLALVVLAPVRWWVLRQRRAAAPPPSPSPSGPAPTPS